MTAIVHRTPGLIDLRAFTTMGMSAKVTDNPIGMFGTGLKYAIAVLVRHGARPVVWIGKDRYEFFCEPTTFRDKEFQLVRMKAKKWSWNKPRVIDLPFTTEYGRNWKMWMAFRELEANTRDEKGETFMKPHEGVAGAYDTLELATNGGVAGYTTVIIDNADYVAAYLDSAETFLENAQTSRLGTEGVQVLEGEGGTRVYYRGMRAYELSKPSLYIYNIVGDIELTEDRTIKSEWSIRSMIAQHVLKSKDRDLIEAITTADDDHWEGGMDWPEYVPPGETFRSVVHSRPSGIRTSVASYYTRHDNRPFVKTEEVLDKHPRPWKLVGDGVVDAAGVVVFTAPYGYKGRWVPVGAMLIDKLGYGKPAEEPPSPEADDYDHTIDPPEDFADV